jgi:hypothetical protein
MGNYLSFGRGDTLEELEGIDGMGRKNQGVKSAYRPKEVVQGYALMNIEKREMWV